MTCAWGSSVEDQAMTANLYTSNRIEHTECRGWRQSVSYVDANGVSRIMILVGDDVTNPGGKRTGVLFY